MLSQNKIKNGLNGYIKPMAIILCQQYATIEKSKKLIEKKKILLTDRQIFFTHINY